MGQRRTRPRANVLRASNHIGAAVAIELDPGIARRMTGAAPLVGRHADATPLSALGWWALIILPTKRVRCPLVTNAQTLGHAQRQILLLIIFGIIFQPQVDGIEHKGARHFIHRRFQGKGGFDMARGAKGDAWSGVDIDPYLFGAYVGAAIEALIHAADVACFTTYHVSADGNLNVDTNRRQCAILFSANPHMLLGGAAVASREIFCFAIEHQLHRPAGLLGEQRRNHRLLPGDLFAAKTTAHMLLDHAHMMLGQPQFLGHLFAHLKDPLRRFPKCQLIALPNCRAAMWLQGVVQRRLRGVNLVDDHIGHLKTGLNIAPFVNSRLSNAITFGVNLRRTRLKRGRHVQDKRQQFILYFDQAQRITCNFFRLGRHRGHFITNKTKCAVKELTLFLVPFDIRGVFRTKHGMDTGQCRGGGYINVADTRIRMWATQNASVKLTRKTHIIGVARTSGHFFYTFDTGMGTTDNGELGVLVPRGQVAGFNDFKLFFLAVA